MNQDLFYDIYQNEKNKVTHVALNIEGTDTGERNNTNVFI